MKGRRNLIIVAIVFIVLLVGATLSYTVLSGRYLEKQRNNEPTVPVSQALESAKAFNMKDKTGETVSSTSFTGKPVVMNFWASWCGPCKMEMPDFEKMYQQYGEEIQFAMINLITERETKETGMAYVEKNNFTFPIYFDVDEEGASAYKVYSIPTTVFINADGKVQKVHTGYISRQQLEQEILSLLETKA